jgi:polyhydroxybutyrate depolymerase
MSALSKETFMFGGIERIYFLHVPPSYDGNKPFPLVIVLHGRTQSPLDAQIYFTTAKSDKEGFIVVYPEGLVHGAEDTCWNVGSGRYKFDTDDVGFIRELINRLEQGYNIDQKRIYVAGGSNGAMMAYLLGAEFSDRIAAIASVAGSIGVMTDQGPEQIPEPSQPVSVIIIHGTEDESIPYEGGGSWNRLSVAESVAFWVKHNGCSTNSQNETSSDGQVVKSVYTGGTNGTEVVLYTLVGYGHIWPTTSSSPISATDIVWDFFASHPKQ